MLQSLLSSILPVDNNIIESFYVNLIHRVFSNDKRFQLINNLISNKSIIKLTEEDIDSKKNKVPFNPGQIGPPKKQQVRNENSDQIWDADQIDESYDVDPRPVPE